MQGPAINMGQMLKLFFEAIKSPAFQEEEIEKEKTFLLNVLRSLDDDPFQAAMRFKKAFYGVILMPFPLWAKKKLSAI